MRSITTFVWLCCALAALMAVAKPIRSNAGGNGTNRSAEQALPYDAEVEYLQSTGSEAVIIPASIANTITKYALDCMYAVAANQAMAISAGYLGLASYAGKYRCQWTRYGSYSTTISSTSRIVFVLDMLAHSGSFYAVSGELLDTATDGNIKQTSGTSIQLFGTAAAGMVSARARVFGFVAYSGDAVALNLIPVRKGNEGFLYDKVSGTLFANEGSGSFVLGPDVPVK